jgi:membrane protease YdiL (CAAX protease family)
MIAKSQPRGRPRYAGLALLVYGAMTVCAIVIAWARSTSLLRRDAEIAALDSTSASLALGAVLAVVTIGGTRVLVLRSRWGKTLRDDFRALLADATPSDTIWLALLSGVGEELLFRGALLPWWGLAGSSLAFGVLHVGPSRRFLGWTVWASVLGVLLAGICEATGRIEGAVLAHVTINAVNLRFVLAFDGRLDTPRTDPGEQALVGRRARRETR